MKSWKTTIAGILVGVIAGATALHYISAEQAVAITAALTSVGLMSAKDNNVTGGTKQL